MGPLFPFLSLQRDIFVLSNHVKPLIWQRPATLDWFCISLFGTSTVIHTGSTFPTLQYYPLITYRNLPWPRQALALIVLFHHLCLLGPLSSKLSLLCGHPSSLRRLSICRRRTAGYPRVCMGEGMRKPEEFSCWVDRIQKVREGGFSPSHDSLSPCANI